MRSESVLIDTDYDAIVHRRRSRFVFEVSIFSLIILLIYFVVDLYVSTNADLIVIALFGMIFFVILYLLDAKKAKQASIILAVIGLIGLFFGASNDEVGDYGLFFFSEFPILAFFLFGKREGFRWTFVLVGLMVVAFILGQQHLLFTSFSLRSWIFFAGSFSVIFVMTYLYQDLVEASERIIANRDRELAKERDQARTIVTSIGEGLFVIDSNNQIVSVNPTTEKLLGVTGDQVLNHHINDIFRVLKADAPIPDTDHPALAPLVTGKVMTINLDDNLVCAAPNGRQFPVSLVASPLLADNKVTGAVVAFRDITSDKAAADFIAKEVTLRTQEVHEGEARLLASINSLTVGYIMTNEQPAIVLRNKAATTILGRAGLMNALETPENQPQNALTIESLDQELGSQAQLLKKITESIQNNQEISLDTLVYNNIFLQLFISPITFDKKVIGAVILLQDVTEARVLERSKDELFSIASHELRTPLTAIRGYSALIEQKYAAFLTDPKLKTMIAGIHSSSIRLIHIVNDFLDTSRLEQKRMSFSPAPFNLETLINEVIDEYSDLAHERNLELKFNKISADLKPAYADQERVKQVLINLVGNAIKFTTQGRVAINVQPEEHRLKVEVTDTGKGIAPANQTLLFRKFQQAGQNIISRDASRGTGLGLYISKLIIESMGGAIWLERSDIGQGSTFAFTLPVAASVDK